MGTWLQDFMAEPDTRKALNQETVAENVAPPAPKSIGSQIGSWFGKPSNQMAINTLGGLIMNLGGVPKDSPAAAFNRNVAGMLESGMGARAMNKGGGTGGVNPTQPAATPPAAPAAPTRLVSAPGTNMVDTTSGAGRLNRIPLNMDNQWLKWANGSSSLLK